ncbi:MAG TPA: 4-alpha-glucanotransferase [Flavitalea sp.]|nr:4-alpha-glucanotransferase [Flavitalea sp.]
MVKLNPLHSAGLPRRSAGILMHITSLSGPSYTGDIGPCAKLFANFLAACQQSVWQMLPIQPVTAEQGYSPYSTCSAMATNPLLISPELLLQKKLIDPEDTIKGKITDTPADFRQAEIYKQKLLNKAWLKWKETKSQQNKVAFETFCSNEHEWLQDYALYMVLKLKYKNKPWYEWPAEFRDRDRDALKSFESENADELFKVKWIQMTFKEQWSEFRLHCRNLNIRLLGDIPIYVAHDSADVWSNRNIFTLRADGSLDEVAGVPPDLFNNEGQLWGMPLYRWDVLKTSGYDWWIKRFKKNFEWFDMLRLDHFRGFSSYWTVPADAKTAKSGQWKPGPGRDFFEAVKCKLGTPAFVAEDLGEIDDAVYQLRDDLELPGMNVLQFAFGDDLPDSNYLPHNHTVNSVLYTGTHDNNTTSGWFRHLSRKEKDNISTYMGVTINAKNVSDQLCRLAYMSVSMLTILPMQDVLGLSESSRMNMPATLKGNWTWRLNNKLLTSSIENKLKSWIHYFGRK